MIFKYPNALTSCALYNWVLERKHWLLQSESKAFFLLPSIPSWDLVKELPMLLVEPRRFPASQEYVVVHGVVFWQWRAFCRVSFAAGQLTML